MVQKVKIIEVIILEGGILVTFFDGRIARLDSNEIRVRSIEAPDYPDTTSEA